jgi:hypothetical protein
MKHWIACLALGSILLVAGCDSMNHSQLRVAPPPVERRARAVLPAADRDAIKQVLSEIGTKHRMEDRTSLCLIPDTLCSYGEVDKKYPLRFVAWVKDQNVYVDIFQRPPEAGETIAYQKLRGEIMAALDSQFGNRLQMIHKIDQVTSKAPLPPAAQ